MNTPGIHVFDETHHEANLWIKELSSKLHTNDPHIALVALRATLHAVRDQLQIRTIAHFGDQLPILVRGIYYEGWNGKGSHERHAKPFLDHVHEGLKGHAELSAERALRATVEVLFDHLDPGQMEKMVDQMPQDLFDMWPSYPMPR
jgi:uncharacterized protein (DUF2267 family)